MAIIGSRHAVLQSINNIVRAIQQQVEFQSLQRINQMNWDIRIYLRSLLSLIVIDSLSLISLLYFVFRRVERDEYVVRREYLWYDKHDE